MRMKSQQRKIGILVKLIGRNPCANVMYDSDVHSYEEKQSSFKPNLLHMLDAVQGSFSYGRR
jgi:hypothetical protein